jgi:hypothetical protein
MPGETALLWKAKHSCQRARSQGPCYGLTYKWDRTFMT